ncbi:hypothetical protein MJO29_001999 [Puccinia striiformis f. sp. tritici]|nr:hypothetical protein MJO29_001999 [Puccinia striiformis f. sp. tritici]
MTKIQLREATPAPDSSPHIRQSQSTSKKSTPNRAPANKNKAATPKGTPAKLKPSTPKRTPSGQQKPVATPKTNSSKVNPLQMVTKNMPGSFAATRDALYAHIKLIWNLIEQKVIPKPPHRDTPAEFNSRFFNVDNIEYSAGNTSGAPLIPVAEVVTFKDLKCGQKKIGKGLVNVEEFFLSYTKATLARLGIRTWAPNLEDSHHSLYNKACRQAALMTFRQAALGGAYTYMNINKKYAVDLGLLVPTYNHYVHFLHTQRYNREKTQTRKFRMEEERKVIAKARERLRDSQSKFALAQGLPKRYQKVISDVNCHSDDEYSAGRGYIIKTLKFRSPNATKFFRRVDAAILKSDELEGKRIQRRRRIVPSTPQESLFPKPPKGQPLDFYEPEWFNDLLPQQRIDTANTHEVAFLPDASQSLMGKKLASEKLSDRKFTKQFFDRLSKPYDLTHEIEAEEDDADDSDVEEDNSYAGEEINLADTSGEDDDEYNEMEEELSGFLDDFGDNTMETSDHEEQDYNEDDDNGELEHLTSPTPIMLDDQRKRRIGPNVGLVPQLNVTLFVTLESLDSFLLFFQPIKILADVTTPIPIMLDDQQKRRAEVASRVNYSLP